MIYLGLAIVASSVLSIMMKYSGTKTDNTCGVALFNYVTCFTIAFLFFAGKGFAGLEGKTVLLGAAGGAIYLVTILLLLVNINRIGAILPTVFNRLGVLITVILSFTVFGESPTAFQIAGIVLALVSIVVINYKKSDGAEVSLKTGRERKLQIIGLILLMVAGGFCDSTTKFFEYFGNSADNDRFIFFVFLFAALFALIPLIKSGKKLSWKVVFYGFLVGFPNYFITRFLLASLATMQSFIVYPSYSVGTVILTSILSRIVFKEKLSRQQFAGIGIILVSLVLLNI